MKYILSNNIKGGTNKYVKELISTYPHLERIVSYEALISKNISSNDTIFIQHLMNTNTSIEQLIDMKEKTGCKIIIILHDFYWFMPYLEFHDPFTLYLQNIVINPLVKKLFDIVNLVVAPSLFLLTHYKKYFQNNLIMNPHNDYIIENTKNIPMIENCTIHIASLREYNTLKGSENIDFLEYNCKTYKGFTINVMRTGWHIPNYQEQEFFTQIEQYKIHGLLHLNKYADSYDYSLTKSLNSGLPILYNNIGSYKERIPQKDHYFKVIDDESQYYDRELLKKQFEKMLDYIIENNGKYNHMNKSYDFDTNTLNNFLFSAV